MAAAEPVPEPVGLQLGTRGRETADVTEGRWKPSHAGHILAKVVICISQQEQSLGERDSVAS